MRVLKYISITLYLIILFLIFFYAGRTGEESTKDSDTVTDIVVDVVDSVTPGDVSIKDKYSMDQIKTFVRKGIGHFGMFMALGFFAASSAYFIFKKKLWLFIVELVSGFVVAGGSEIVQKYTDSRGPAFKDVLLDYSGYLSGSIFMCVIIVVIILIVRKRGVKNGN